MKFSIGIPAYKTSFLKECIDSVLAQTFRDFQLVIVNDCSPQNVEEVVQDYSDTRIIYAKNDRNIGAENVVDNWNKCLSLATGEYFVLLGDDDKLAPEYLEEFHLLTERFADCNVYHCRALIIDENSNPIDLTEPRPEIEGVYDLIYQRIAGKRTSFISDYLFRTEYLKNAGGFFKLPLAWASDDVSSYMAAVEKGIAHTNKPVFLYRRSSQTISSSGSIQLKMDSILGEEKWLLDFLNNQVSDPVAELTRRNSQSQLKKYIQKKKIWTIYFSNSSNIITAFFSWTGKRRQYQLSLMELVVGLVLGIAHRGRRKYLDY